MHRLYAHELLKLKQQEALAEAERTRLAGLLQRARRRTRKNRRPANRVR